MQVSKVESHQERYAVMQEGVEALLLFLGSERTDALASEAAARAQLPGHAVKAFLDLEARADLVLRPLGAVTLDAAQRELQRSPPEAPPRRRAARVAWAVRLGRARASSAHRVHVSAIAVRQLRRHLRAAASAARSRSAWF